MYFLGIDPSATSTGYAVIDSVGNLITVGSLNPNKLRKGERLSYLRNNLVLQIKNLSPIMQAAIEAPAYGASMGADLLGQVRGIFLLLLHDLQVDVVLPAPTALKKFATRNGGVDKEAMVSAAQDHWTDWIGDVSRDDEADALWLAEIARGCLFPKGMTRAQLEVLHQLKKLRKGDV